jgi:hypothetical protein
MRIWDEFSDEARANFEEALRQGDKASSKMGRNQTNP